MPKIFVIGFNKTATVTLHNLFLQNGLKSQHDGSKWNIDEYQCFSDNGNYRDWKKYEKLFPDSIFILNTRSLYNWLKSRSFHCFQYKDSWGFPPNIEQYKTWTHMRNQHYFDVLQHFKKMTNRLYIVNIDNKDWLTFIGHKLNLKNVNNNLKRNTKNKNIPTNFQIDVQNKLNKALRDGDISNAHEHFIVQSLLTSDQLIEYPQLLKIYETNF